MTDRRRVVLHIGMGKTGTTSIQALCNVNRDLLGRHGVLYPASPGRNRHTRLGLAMQDDADPPRQSVDWQRQEVSQPSELRPIMEAELRAEIGASDAHTVLLSDEALLIAEETAQRRVRDLLDQIASRVRVVAYVRRQDEHLCSRYQQTVKLAGETRRLAERIAEPDLDRVYDYHARLDAWRELVRPEELVLRTYERSRLAGTTLEQDFLEAAGVALDTREMEMPGARNESLDAESVEFLRIVNIWHRERGELPPAKPRRRLMRRLQEGHPPGAMLTLPTAQLDDFMSRWDASNRAVARDYAPGGPPALFADERRSAGATSDQRLDPARLEHFLELAQLPPRRQAALRRIAEREAG